MQTALQNLVHQQLWTDCSVHDEGLCVLRGTPPQKLHPDDVAVASEHVLVSNAADGASVAMYSHVFAALRVPRLVHAIVAEDSTVVYYIVYNKLQMPRRN